MGGRAVVSGLPEGDCVATVRGDTTLTFPVEPGGSYGCDAEGCRPVR